MRLTTRARVLAFTAAAAMVIALMPARPVKAQVDAGAIIAYLTGVMATVIGPAITWVQQNGFQTYVHKGNESITKQVATNTLGVQSALQANAATNVEAMNRQTKTMLEYQYKSVFGTFGRYGNINIGSTAPLACRRHTEASVLAKASDNLPHLRQQAGSLAAAHDKGYGSSTGAAAAMRKDVAQRGGEVLALDWLHKDSLNPTETENAWRAINYATNPNPPPAPPTGASNTLAGQEYAAQYQRFQEMVKLPQQVLARQANLRAQVPGDNEKRSWMSIVEGWSQAGVEDPQHPVALQVKTEAGVQRDMALSLQAMLNLEAERLRTEQESAAMLAMLLSSQLQREAADLRSKHADTVMAE